MQPYTTFGEYRLKNGQEVTVKWGAMSQTWDLQSFYSPARIVQGPNSKEVIEELISSYPEKKEFKTLVPPAEPCFY